jgi:hypothetical protein
MPPGESWSHISIPLSIRPESGLPVKEAVCDIPDTGDLDRLALGAIEDGRASVAFCCLCRLMRSLVLILEGVREVLFHTGETEEVAAPPADGVGSTLEPVE